MNPIDLYRADIKAQRIEPDPHQEQVMRAFDHIYQALEERQHHISFKLFRYFKLRLQVKQSPVKGLYLWGGVGRGKTYLMDLFYDALSLREKKRLHFHHFMQEAHQQLKAYQGQKDPLRKIAQAWGKECQVLCFDEFTVSDVADAMILGKLIEYLFEMGITLISTSNLAPDDLYANGLQRGKFLPAIALIKKHTTVIHLDHGKDYRLLFLKDAEIYHHPLDDQATQNLERYFEQLAPHAGEKEKTIEVLNRSLKTVWEADSIVWFEFLELCEGPRSQLDYIEIARVYHTVFLSNVTIMDKDKEGVAKRFVMLVDILYDHNVTLIISATVGAEDLYQGARLQFDFQRTISRLQEMQSKEYLAQKHIV